MRTSSALLAAALLVAAAPAVAADQYLENLDGTCEVRLPSDWTVLDFDARDPAETMTVSVFHEPDATVEPRDNEFLSSVFGATQVFENTDSRLFVESPGATGRKWVAFVPAGADGACRVVVVFRDGGSEEIARSVVMSLQPVS